MADSLRPTRSDDRAWIAALLRVDAGAAEVVVSRGRFTEDVTFG